MTQQQIITYQFPSQHHARQIFSVAENSPPLEVNTCYAYNLFVKHFGYDGTLVALRTNSGGESVEKSDAEHHSDNRAGDQHTTSTDSAAAASKGTTVVGYIQAYRPPQKRDSLFVWQVGVDPSARGNGVGTGLLKQSCWNQLKDGVRYLEATIAPSNKASQALFHGFAKKLNVPIEVEEDYLSADCLSTAAEQHEREDLYRVGPFSEKDFQRVGWMQ